MTAILELGSTSFGADANGARGTVARLDDDNFLVILPDSRNADHAHDLGERMLAVVAEPFPIDEVEHYLTTSVGVALYPDNAQDDQALTAEQ